MLSDSKAHSIIIENQDFYIHDTIYDSLSLVFTLFSGNQYVSYALTQKEKNIYSDRYVDEVSYFEINDRFDSISHFLKRERFVTYVLEFDFSFMHFSLEEYVERYNSLEPYVEIWESEYVWVLFRWIKIRRENRGIS
ncbi:MAG: hypothetical protein AAF363_22305 [Bacteroidota bacterium]